MIASPAGAEDRPPQEPCSKWSRFSWSRPTQKRAFLGVYLLKLTDELRAHFGAPKGAGLLIAKVERGGPAEHAGIRVGDLLVGVGGTRVTSTWDVLQEIRDKKEGVRVALKVIRNGSEKTLTARLKVRERPQVEVSRFFSVDPEKAGEFGFRFDTRSFDRAMDCFRKRMERPGQPKKMDKLFKREHRLEKRLKEMEKKLRELERKLQGKRRSGGKRVSTSV
jgi:membrane-associated protease RseP (regulator of RpoE activity)